MGVFFFSVQFQIRQQEEVEKKAEVAMEMSDLVVYCQPRSKEKDRFGKRAFNTATVTQTGRAKDALWVAFCIQYGFKNQYLELKPKNITLCFNHLRTFH